MKTTIGPRALFEGCETSSIADYTSTEASTYAKERGKNTRFFVNCYGHTIYYTLRPTWCTFSGKVKGFPRTAIVKAHE